MGSLCSLSLIVLSLASFASTSIDAQGTKSARLLDLAIRDYTFQSYNRYFRTGMIHSVHLPANLSGIGVHTARFRCGSLRRYGAQVKEFHLGVGVIVRPCVERVMVVRQNLGFNWSSMYYSNYYLSGYKLVSPVLGLLAYNAGHNMNFSNPFEVGILAARDPITVDFSNYTFLNNTVGLMPLCASFQHDGKVRLARPMSPNVCAAMAQGHFGLVIESPVLVPERKKVNRWIVAIGPALGAFLLSLLLIALFVKVKKKARREEMERRAYDEEALQVTMVGHLRALRAPVTRTPPSIEHQYRPSPS